jgi:hypothetical protein
MQDHHEVIVHGCDSQAVLRNLWSHKVAVWAY